MDRETLRKLLHVCDLRCFDEEGFRCSETFCEAEERIWAELERLKAKIQEKDDLIEELLKMNCGRDEG